LTDHQKIVASDYVGDLYGYVKFGAASLAHIRPREFSGQTGEM